MIASANVDQFSYFFHCKFQKESAEEDGIKIITSLPLKSVATIYLVKSKWSTIQLYITTQLIQFKVVNNV